MKIDRKGSAPSPPPSESAPAEWCVRVSISVVTHTPSDVLRHWIAVESFARSGPECWPGNKALAARMGLTVRPTQAALDRLEDLGIVQRRRPGGNRRTLLLIRRTHGDLSAAEWAGMAARAATLAAGRKALATARRVERKRHKPSIRIVG